MNITEIKSEIAGDSYYKVEHVTINDEEWEIKSSNIKNLPLNRKN